MENCEPNRHGGLRNPESIGANLKRRNIASAEKDESRFLSAEETRHERTSHLEREAMRSPPPVPPKTVEAARTADHYTQLGVHRNATAAEIRRAYHRLVFEHHPDKVDRAEVRAKEKRRFDKQVSSSSGSWPKFTDPQIHDIDGIDLAHNFDIDTDEEADTDTDSIAEEEPVATASVDQKSRPEWEDFHGTMFTLITDAYNVLNDSVLRAEYDLANGFMESSSANLAALHIQQRNQAMKDIELMQVTYESRRIAEEDCRGVVILSAFYGALHNYVNTRRSITKSSVGPTLDVTVQVQCAVEASTLYVEGGISKVAALRGFYHPSMGDLPKVKSDRSGDRYGSGPRLCIRYLFRGKQHQASVGDCEELKIPMRSHQLAPGQQFKIRRKSRRKRKDKIVRSDANRSPITSETRTPLSPNSMGAVSGTARGKRVQGGSSGIGSEADVGEGMACAGSSVVRGGNIDANRRDQVENDFGAVESPGGSGLTLVLFVAAAIAVGMWFSRQKT